MPGPAPKDPSERARRNATVSMTALPAQGRTGPTPKWPLIDDLRLTVQAAAINTRIADLQFLVDDDELTPAKRARLDQKIAAERMSLAVVEEKLSRQRSLERNLWKELWRTPQAAAWEHLGWTRDVATYARLSVLAEMGDMPALQEARMWSDRLGLTPMAMLRLRWKVSTDEVGEKRDQSREGSRTGTRARRGALRSVPPATGA